MLALLTRQLRNRQGALEQEPQDLKRICIAGQYCYSCSSGFPGGPDSPNGGRIEGSQEDEAGPYVNAPKALQVGPRLFRLLHGFALLSARNMRPSEHTLPHIASCKYCRYTCK